MSLDIDPQMASETAQAITVRADGRIVIAGGARTLDEGSILNTQSFTAARLLSDGSPDPSFGSNGRVVTATTTSFTVLVRASALVVRPDGGLLLIGTRLVGDIHTCYKITVAALTSSGDPLTSYGASGLAEGFGTQCEQAYDGALVSDGQLVTSYAGVPSSLGDDGNNPRGFLLVFDTSGSPRLFGGQLGERLSDPSRVNAVSGMPGGGVVAAGYGQWDFCHYSGERKPRPCRALMVVRVDDSGTLDRSYGQDGIATVPATCPAARLGDCAISRARFKRLARRGLPTEAALGRGVRLQLTCRQAIGERCVFRLSVEPGRTRRGCGSRTGCAGPRWLNEACDYSNRPQADAGIARFRVGSDQRSCQDRVAGGRARFTAGFVDRQQITVLPLLDEKRNAWKPELSGAPITSVKNQARAAPDLSSVRSPDVCSLPVLASGDDDRDYDPRAEDVKADQDQAQENMAGHDEEDSDRQHQDKRDASQSRA